MQEGDGQQYRRARARKERCLSPLRCGHTRLVCAVPKYPKKWESPTFDAFGFIPNGCGSRSRVAHRPPKHSYISNLYELAHNPEIRIFSLPRNRHTRATSPKWPRPPPIRARCYLLDTIRQYQAQTPASGQFGCIYWLPDFLRTCQKAPISVPYQYL